MRGVRAGQVRAELPLPLLLEELRQSPQQLKTKNLIFKELYPASISLFLINVFKMKIC
jgi:hypothetical protein